MVWAAALILASEAAIFNADNAFVFQTSGHSFYYVPSSEIKIEYRGGANHYTFWLHGEHRADKDVPYRSSVWHITMDCDGYYWISDFTTYRADGSVKQSRDGEMHRYAIRPGEMYQSLEQAICKK